MRNLEDCKAEVFRRSEEKIKERKRIRNRTLVCGISLCLLLVVGGIYVRPLFEPVDESSKSGGKNTVTDRELGGLSAGSTVTYVSVKITDGTGISETSWEITEVTAVEDLCRFVMTCFDASLGKENIPADGAEGSIIDEIEIKYGLGEKQADYKFVFQAKTGQEFVYSLYGDVLYDEKQDCSVKLDQIQLSALKTQIGLMSK